MTGPGVVLAYIDPGSGSILIQIIIGTLLAVPFVLRSQLGRAWRALRHRKPAAARDSGSNTTDSGR